MDKHYNTKEQNKPVLLKLQYLTKNKQENEQV